MNETSRDFQTKNEETVHRFIYELVDPSKEFETLDEMDKKTRLLFEILIEQLECEDHPIHILTKRFGFYFTKHY
jgi:hypothetical protein